MNVYFMWVQIKLNSFVYFHTFTSRVLEIYIYFLNALHFAIKLFDEENKNVK